MLYEKLKELSAANFKRYCGVERKTFDKMCAHRPAKVSRPASYGGQTAEIEDRRPSVIDA